MNINKLKTRTMKNKLIVFVMAIMLMPITGMAQKNIFDKYSDNNDVTYVNIKPKMFQMITKIGVNVDDPEAKAYMDMIKSITSFKTIVTDKAAISADIAKWVKSRSGGLEELMEVKDDGTEIKFYVKEGKDADFTAHNEMAKDGAHGSERDGSEDDHWLPVGAKGDGHHGKNGK